jgi:hypothetical protein
VTGPLPVPLAGVQVSQVALLAGVQVQPAPAVTFNVPLPPAAATDALPGETE